MTSALDAFEHLVAEEAMAPGNAGRYAALCGREVWAAALAAPAGPRCPVCVAVHNTDAAGRTRHRRPVWARLTRPAAPPASGALRVAPVRRCHPAGIGSPPARTTPERPAMITTNGSDHQAVAEARPVVLVRYRPGVTGEATRTVHVVPLPLDGQPDAATALCGTRLLASEMEIVTPGHGMPCNRCLVGQIAASPA
ncbi:MAG: hypothetical protein ACRDRA_11800, partial [Pseudonocardiaceae bacterium]